MRTLSKITDIIELGLFALIVYLIYKLITLDWGKILGGASKTATNIYARTIPGAPTYSEIEEMYTGEATPQEAYETTIRGMLTYPWTTWSIWLSQLAGYLMKYKPKKETLYRHYYNIMMKRYNAYQRILEEQERQKLVEISPWTKLAEYFKKRYG